MSKIAENELQELQGLHAEFNKIKSQLGDIALQKHALCLKTEAIKKLSRREGLMEKYGENAVINLETGEVKRRRQWLNENTTVYPTVTPASEDLLIATDVSDNNKTVTFLVSDVARTGVVAQGLQSVLDTGNTATQIYLLQAT